MAKRGAGSYLTDQNWDQEEEVEEAGQFSQASAEEIGKRQIRKAKRRVQGEGSGAAAEAFKSATSSAFKGFSGFTGLTNTSTPAKPTFSFGGESKPLSVLSNGSSTSKTTGFPASSSLFKSQEKDTKTKESSAKSNDEPATSVSNANGAKKSSNRCKYLQQLRSLNESVSKWIQQHVEKNSSCILTPIFRDYEKHLADIEKKYPEDDEEPQTSSMKEESHKAVPPVTSKASASETTSSAGGFKFNLGSSAATSTTTEVSNSKPLFSFGSSKPESGSGFSFSTSTTVSSTGSDSKPSLFGNVGSGSVKPFSFAVEAAKTSEDARSAKNEEEEYVPPKAEVVEVKEDGSLYTKRCKLFYQKDGSWLEKGVGNLHLKKLEEKTQLLIRADTNLGNILLNIMLTESLPIRRQGKNNVSLICIPNPPIDPKSEDRKPVSLLLRVKTAEDADELEQKLNEMKK